MPQDKTSPSFQMNSQGVCFCYPNNIEVSIVWGAGTYTDNYHKSPASDTNWESNSCEVLLYYKGEELMEGLHHYSHLTISELTILLDTVSILGEDDINDANCITVDTAFRELLLNNRPYLKLMRKSIQAEIKWLDVEDVHTEIKDAK